jgi:hypothetical protein
MPSIWHFDPLRVRLLEAARLKLSECVSTTRNEDTDLPIRVVDTSPKPLPASDVRERSASAWVGVRVQWGARLGEWVVASVSDTKSRVSATSGGAAGQVWDASLADLRTTV